MQNKGPKLSLHLAFDVSFSEHASQHLRPLHTGTATVRPAQRQCKTRDQNYQRTWHLMSASLSMPASISDLSTLVVPTNTGRPVFTIRLISVTTAVHLPACSQPVSQPASQPVCQPASQSLSQPVTQSVSQSVSLSVSQSVSQSISQSGCQSVSRQLYMLSRRMPNTS
jgi:hypothetical protein